MADFDPNSLLNFEKRTGVKDDDIDDFIRKASAVEDAIKGMMEGKVAPEDIKIQGLESDEDKAKLEQERQQRWAESRRKAEELRQQRKLEERERWWAGVEMFTSYRKSGAGDDEDDDASRPDPRSVIMQRYTADYSRWNEWVPADPATLQEEQEKTAAEERVKNEEFERQNAEFCTQFVGDMEERNRAIQKKKETAEGTRNRGNRHFKRGEHTEALALYMDALRLLPYDTKTLCNIAQCHIKLAELDDALDFLGRTLAVEPAHVKALSRQAHVLSERGDYAAALEALTRALAAEPGSAELAGQRREVEAMAREAGEEAALRNMLGPLPPAGVATADADAGSVPPPTASSSSSSYAFPPPPPASSSSSSSSSSAFSADGLRAAQASEQAALKHDVERIDSAHALLKALLEADSRSQQTMPQLLDLMRPLAATGTGNREGAAGGEGKASLLEDVTRRVARTSMAKVHARQGLLTCAIAAAVALAREASRSDKAEAEAEADAALLSSTLSALVRFLTAAIKGERAGKLLLLERAALPALRSLLARPGMPAATSALCDFFRVCGQDDVCKKTQAAVLGDWQLVQAACGAVGEIVAASRPPRLLSSPPSSAAGARASEEEVEAVLGACVACGSLVKEVAFSESGRVAIARPELAPAVCALSSALFFASRSLLWDAPRAVEACLEGLLGLSQVAVLRGAFGVACPVGPQAAALQTPQPPLPPTRPDAPSLSAIEVILKHTLRRPGGHYAATCLAVLMNACLDEGGNRAAVYACGGMDEALKGLALGLGGSGGGSAGATGVAAAADGLDRADAALLLCRQAGLLSRLATVEGAQAVLYLPDNYRLICRGIAARATSHGAAAPTSQGQSAPIDAETETEAEADKHEADARAHLIRTLAALTQPPTECRAVALHEGLVAALLAVFPCPRLDLGEVTPESVILPPPRPACPILLGNTARCLMPYADDPEHAKALFCARALIGVEKIINAVATCSDMRVRKNLAILLAKGCRVEGVREVVTRFRGLQMLTELQDRLVA